jgi:hypothetical protein
MIRIGRGLGLLPQYLRRAPCCALGSAQVSPSPDVQRLALELVQSGQHLGEQSLQLLPVLRRYMLSVPCRVTAFVAMIHGSHLVTRLTIGTDHADCANPGVAFVFSVVGNISPTSLGSLTMF